MKLAGLGALGYALVNFCLWPSKIAATIINRTIDDQHGDPATGDRPIYFPAKDVWYACGAPRCAMVPSAAQAFAQTYTAGTYRPTVGSMGISMQFNGIAIYVFFILVNHEGDGNTTLTSANFTVDDGAPVFFTHSISDPKAPSFKYNASVFSKTNLPNTLHTLKITTTGSASARVIFDYAIYTHDSSSSNPSLAPANKISPKISTSDSSFPSGPSMQSVGTPLPEPSPLDLSSAPANAIGSKSSTSDSSSLSMVTLSSHAFSPSSAPTNAISPKSSTSHSSFPARASHSSSLSVVTTTSYVSSTSDSPFPARASHSSSRSLVAATSYVSPISDLSSLLFATAVAPEKSSSSGATLHSTEVTGAKSLVKAIVGGIAATIVVFGIVILLLFCWRRRGGYHVLQEGQRNDSIPLVMKLKTRPSVRSTTSSMTAVIPARLAIEKGYGYGMTYSDIAPKSFETDYQCDDSRTLPARQVDLYPAGSERFSSFSGKTFVSSTSNSSMLYTNEDRRLPPPALTSPNIKTIQEEMPPTLQEEIDYQLRTVQLNSVLHATGVRRRSQEVGVVETADIGGGRGHQRGVYVGTSGSPVL